MEDKSIIKNTADINETYIDDCIKEVCLEGDSLTKYKRMIEKLYGAEFYKKCGVFVKEVKHSVNRKKFTQTSIANLNHLANEISVTSSTIETLIDYYTKKFANDEKKEKKAARKSVKREEEKIEEVTALMKKVAEAESKKAEAARRRKETAERKKKEAAERMRLMSESIHKEVEEENNKKKEEEEKKRAEERRKRAEERRQLKMLEEKELKEKAAIRQFLLYAIPACCTIIGYLWGTSLIPESWGVKPPIGTTLVGFIAGMIIKAVIEGIIEDD